MAETQEPSIGWGGECHLFDGTALYELKHVVSFGLPNEQADEVEVTHLKSPNKRKEFIAGLSDGGEVQVVLNYRPGSTTDTLIAAARAARDVRQVKFVIPEDGEPAWEITTSCFVKGVDRGTISAGDKMEVTVTLRITGAQTEAAAA